MAGPAKTGVKRKHMTDHQQRYGELVRAYVRARDDEPNRNWRAFLWLVTAQPSLWVKFEPYVDVARATVDFDGLNAGAWSAKDQHVSMLARALFSDAGAVEITAVAGLDDEMWEAVVMALAFYRGRQSPTAV
jgi:hypothetical protein